jgi:opacity protein-like surface antigen
MLNAIYHFDMGEAFSPYAGYGISTAFHEASLEGFSDGPHRAFAYQSKVEIGLNLS